MIFRKKENYCKLRKISQFNDFSAIKTYDKTSWYKRIQRLILVMIRTSKTKIEIYRKVTLQMLQMYNHVSKRNEHQRYQRRTSKWRNNSSIVIQFTCRSTGTEHEYNINIFSENQ